MLRSAACIGRGPRAAGLQWSARLLASRASAGSAPAAPDAFQAQLQAKTERELMQLLERNQQGELHKADSNDEQIKVKKADEVDGPRGPEPTRFGDWEQKGRCTDF